MERVEYTTNGNTVGISVKDPIGIRRKWSEKYTDICCAECAGENISTDKTAEMLAITCHECSNYWYGTVTDILHWYNTEEARITLATITFSEK